MNKKALKINRSFGRELGKLARMAVMLKALQWCADEYEKASHSNKLTMGGRLEIELARNELLTRIIKITGDYSRQWNKVLALGKLLKLELADNKKGAANHG